MDRRTFLKTLASLGVSVALPASLATAASEDIDAVWTLASDAGDLFEVSEYRTLSYAKFERLKETESAGYRRRTKLNIMNCDATLVVNLGKLDGGTLETVKLAKKYGRPLLLLQLDELVLPDAANQLRAWLETEQPQSLNIAGPREEKRPGVYNMTVALLDLCLLPDKDRKGICSEFQA